MDPSAAAGQKKQGGPEDDEDDEESLDWWSRYYETVKDEEREEEDRKNKVKNQFNKNGVIKLGSDGRQESLSSHDVHSFSPLVVVAATRGVNE